MRKCGLGCCQNHFQASVSWFEMRFYCFYPISIWLLDHMTIIDNMCISEAGAQSNPRVMKKTFLLLSSAKDVMACSPRVTCPLIAVRKGFEGPDLIAVCVPACGCQEWPYAAARRREMSRCSQRRLEAGGNGEEREEIPCLTDIIVAGGV